MNLEGLKAQVDKLLELAIIGEQSVTAASQVLQGTLSVIAIIHGPNSDQAGRLLRSVDEHRSRSFMPSAPVAIRGSLEECRGALQNIKAELDGGLVGRLQTHIAGDILSDLLQLSKVALAEPGEDAKNVAAVLAAAAYEDTMRRLATMSGLPRFEKLADTLSALKDRGILVGAQVGIAQSYLGFRNKALHAQWKDTGSGGRTECHWFHGADSTSALQLIWS